MWLPRFNHNLGDPQGERDLIVDFEDGFGHGWEGRQREQRLERWWHVSEVALVSGHAEMGEWNRLVSAAVYW